MCLIFCDFLQADDSGLASYVAGQIDRSLSWKVSFWVVLKMKKVLQKQLKAFPTTLVTVKMINLEEHLFSFYLNNYKIEYSKNTQFPLCFFEGFLNLDRTWSGSRQSLHCQFLWRVFLLLRTVSTIELFLLLIFLSSIYILAFEWLVCWSCSKASCTSWSSWYYCFQPWSSPTWLCSCNYHGTWRGIKT